MVVIPLKYLTSCLLSYTKKVYMINIMLLSLIGELILLLRIFLIKLII